MRSEMWVEVERLKFVEGFSLHCNTLKLDLYT